MRQRSGRAGFLEFVIATAKSALPGRLELRDWTLSRATLTLFRFRMTGFPVRPQGKRLLAMELEDHSSFTVT